MDVSDFSLVTWDGKSLAEQAQHLAPGSHVVKAFNLAHAKVWQMTPPVFDGYDPYSVFAFVSPGRTGEPVTSRWPG